MTAKTTFLVQTFVMKRGRLSPGKAETAPSENGARKRAEAESARAKGAAAVRIVADDETGEVSDAAIIEQFGDVPDDFLDQVRGG